MKNIGWVALVLLCYQQVFGQNKIYIGLKGSPSVTWLQPKSTGLDSEGAKIGFSYGLITDFGFHENYAFGTGIEVNHMGGEVKFENQLNGEGGTSRETYNLQYIQVPLTLKMRTKEIGYFTYYGQFGLGASFLIGAKADTEFSNGGVSIKESDVNVYDNLRPFRASMIIGLGAEYNLSGSTHLLIGLTFDNGFVNPLKGKVYEDDGNGQLQEGEKRKVNANLMSLTLGIIF